MRPHLRSAALASAGALLLAACQGGFHQASPSQTGPWPGGSSSHGPQVPPDESWVYGQEISWTACGELECASIQVPLDWGTPNGPTITLALNRHLARDPGSRLGSVVINPGGPGGSGLELTEYFASFAGDALLERYDIVGFDPRGVGASTPVSCGTDAELDDFYTSDTVLETQEDLDASRARSEAFARRCAELTGPVIEHVDTASAARDMDVIRHLVGDERLNYLGFSYGSQLGATYVALHPERAGRIVLDGAVDFVAPPEQLSADQAAGFEAALDAYIGDCITRPSCPLPADRTLAKRAIADLLDEARERGIPSSGGFVNGATAVYGMVVTLYDEANWTYLSSALDEALNDGTADLLRFLADFYLDRDESGRYLSNSAVAFTAVGCLDRPDEPLATLAEHREFGRAMREASPTFGWWFASNAGCEGWPWVAREFVADLTPATQAESILVVGTTGDPATPLKWAEALAGRLPNSSLLVYEGEGHTAYGRSNQCVIDAVDEYLITGELPDSGKRC